jgi:membrane dipeptidase
MELLLRGWTEDEIAGAMGGNLLRVMEAVETERDRLSGTTASRAVYEYRRDLPAKWGGPGGSYLPEDVRRQVGRLASRGKDEL